MPPNADQLNDERRITYFAATHTRGKRNLFGIRAIDRGKHMYVIGKTGMGKSTLLENLAIQDIQNGEGICFIDPHGSTAEKILDFVPHERVKDVLYFAPFDTEYPVGFNVMEDVGYDKRHLVVSGLMGAFKRIWVDAWSARMEYILQNTLLGLLEFPDATLLDVNRMLSNKVFRKAVVDKITDPVVGTFWREEFATYTDRYTQEATPAIQNKVGQFVSNPLVRNIVGQPKSSFDLREMMDQRKIFIVNLSKGRMGESNAALLGSMLTVKIYLAAMSRADEPASRMAQLPRVYFYVDEFQSMMNEAFADILSESRKYKLALTLANQYIEQMEENVRDAVFGNVGTLISFRVGPFDAEVLKTVFEPTFTAEDQVLLGVGQIYLTLMIDGVGSAPFSAETMPPIERPNISYRDDVVTNSRKMYGRLRAEVEQIVAKRQQDYAPPVKQEKPEGDRRPPRMDDRRPDDRRSDERRGEERRPDERRFDSGRDDRRAFDDRRPRDDRPRFPQAERNVPERRATNTPPHHVPQDSRPVPTVAHNVPKTSEPDPRAALRAAISQVQPPPEESKSVAPIDVLRARMAGKPNPVSSVETDRTSEMRVPHIQQTVPASAAEPVKKDDTHTGEVSPEELRRVLYGEAGTN